MFPKIRHRNAQRGILSGSEAKGGRFLLAGLLLLIGSVSSPVPARAAAQDPFPVYRSIRDNVEFWKKIYGTYNTRQWVFHDPVEMGIVYRVVDMPRGVCPYSLSGEKAADRHRRAISGLLLRLAEGATPRDQEERRILSLFGSKPDRARIRVAAGRVRVQLGQADRFREGVIRSGKYMNMIRRTFQEEGLPPDLAYLPHVESSFDNEAYSRFGAAGIWQFTRSTGRHYMQVGYLVDERRDPGKASRSAAKLLAQNYHALKSWPLAVTAYNHGMGSLVRAVRKGGMTDYESVFKHHRDPNFGFASRNFYSEFLAARHVAKNHKKYFGALPLMKPAVCEEIELPRQADIATLSRTLKVSREDLADLNPAVRPVAFRSRRQLPKGYVLHVPQREDQNYRALVAALPTPGRPPTSGSGDWVRVIPGDTLIEIARSHGVKVADLKAANDLEDDWIVAGQHLRLPAGTDVAGGHVEPQRKTVPRPVLMSTIESSDPHRPPKPSDLCFRSRDAVAMGGSYAVRNLRGEGRNASGVITVEPGETLGHYAGWLGTSSRAIRNLNGFSSRRRVRIGEAIRIPLMGSGKEEFERKRLEYHSGIEEDFFAGYRVADVVEHKVRQGDSIWTLCNEDYETPFWLVAVCNQGKDLESLAIGDVVTIPVLEPVATP